MNYTEHEAGLMEESLGAFAPEQLPEDSIVYTRAFIAKRADGTFRRVTVYEAAVFLDNEMNGTEEATGYEVQEITEILDYTDPEDAGGSETYSDYQYEHPYHVKFDTVAEANEKAKAAITGFWSAEALTLMTSYEK